MNRHLACVIAGLLAGPASAQIDVGPVLPADCVQGRIFVLTTGTRGENIYVCLGREWVKQAATGGGTGDVTGPSSSVDSELALFSGTTGKTIKRATTTGIPKLTTGVIGAAVAGTDYLAPPSGTALLKANSGGALANAIAGTDYSPPLSTTVPSLSVNATTGAISPAAGYVHDIRTVTVNVSSAEILAISTTPKEIIAAPGANKQIVPLHILIEYDYGTATYSAASFLALFFGSSASGHTAVATNCVGAGQSLITRTSDAACQWGGIFGAGNGAYSDLKSTINLTNKALTLSSSSNPTSGDGTLRITVTYRVIDTAL